MKPVTNMQQLPINQQGMVIAEFAFMLPVFLILTLGVIEFGMYFVKTEIAGRAISTISLALQRDPTAFNQPPAQLNALVKSYGSGLVNFSPIGSNTGNYICVDAYLTQTQAAAAPPCTDTHFHTANPNGPNSTIPYYVAVRADLQKGTVTPLGNFIPMMRNIQVTQSSGPMQVGSFSLPVCNQPGWALTFDGLQFNCVPVTPCLHPWQKWVFDGTNFNCINFPYVIAGGVAGPASNFPTGALAGSSWITDKTYITGTHDDWTICKNNVTFPIPANLPPGQIITQGNLFYPINGANITWHAWTISFLNLKAPITGGTGSMDACEASGGNWRSIYWPDIHAEHISWTATYMPY
jgi:Flp pilus assembly protein TadG